MMVYLPTVFKYLTAVYSNHTVKSMHCH